MGSNPIQVINKKSFFISKNLIKMNYILTLTNIKQIKKRNITKFKSGDILEIVFFNRYLKQNFLHTFKGMCLGLSKNTLNLTCILRNIIKKTAIEQLFLLYSPHIVEIFKYYNLNKRKSKLYFFRKLPKPYSKFKL